jgi:hypothetical protein
MDPQRQERRRQAKRRYRRRLWRRRWQRLTQPLRWLRSLATVPVLVAIGLVSVLVWTGERQLRHFRDRQQAEQRERLGREGLDAVERGDFERADRIFEPIRATLDITSTGQGGAYAAAAREANVLANMLLDPLDRTLALVAKAPAADRAQRLGQGVVWESALIFTEQGEVELDTRAFVHERPVRIRLGSVEQARNAGIDRPGRWLIGGRLGSLQLEQNEWVLRVDPSTLIPLWHEQALEVLGLSEDAELRQQLSQQRQQRTTGHEETRP